MKFSLNLNFVLPKMGNCFDDEIEDIDPQGELTWELIKMLIRGELEFEVNDDGFLVLDVPDWLLDAYGYPPEEADDDA